MKPHDYQETHGGNCACGKSWYHEEHFDGDRKAAADAYRADMQAEQDVYKIASQLTVATRVRIRGTHPRWPGKAGIITYTEISGRSSDRKVSGFCTVQIEDVPLPQNIPARYLTIAPLVVPKFDSIEEAEQWLEEHNPVPQPKPRFATQEEADRFLNEGRCSTCRHRRDEHWQNAHTCQPCQDVGLRCTTFVEWDGSCSVCGHPTDHDGRPCSSVPQGHNARFDMRGLMQSIRRDPSPGVDLSKPGTYTLTYDEWGDLVPSAKFPNMPVLLPGDEITITTTMTMETD